MGKKRISFVLALQTGQFNTALTMAQKKLTRVSGQMKKVGASMSRNVTMPFVAIGVAGAKMAVDFDKNMTKIETLVGLTTKEVNAMRGEVMKLSGATAQAPADLADGLFFLTSAGLRGANAMQTLESVSKGVAIGLGEQADLAKVAAAAQNAYGEETLSASDALDIFGGMVQTGMFESSELAGVLGTQLGLASSLGVSFEELGAMISTYTKTTGDANAATTGLSGIMMSFAKITPQQEQALESVGMTVDGLRDKLGSQGLQATLLDMQSAFQNNNVDLSKFFSKSQALKGVLGVLGNQTDTYKETLDQLSVSTGFVEKGFDRVVKGPGFQMEKTFNNLKLAGQQIGEALLPVMLKLANFVAKAATAFTNLDSGTKQIIVGVGLLIAGIGPMLTLIGSIGTALVALTGPIGIAIAAIAGIGSAFIFVRHNWEAIKERLGDWMWLKNAILDAIGFLLEWNPFSLIIKGYNELLSYFGQNPVPNPFEQMETALDELKGETKEYENQFSTFGEALSSTANEVKGAISNMMGGSAIVSDIETTEEAAGELEKTIKKVGDTAKETGEQIAKFMGKTADEWTTAADTLADKFSKAAEVANLLNGVMQQFADNEIERIRQKEEADLLALEGEQARAVERIENSTMSEEEKTNALLAIDEDFNKKKNDVAEAAGVEQRKLQRKQAMAQKVADLFSIAASTARSIAAAVAASPLTGGMPWSGINAGIGIAQAAAIASAPLPALAQGGLAFGPTLSLVGDNAGASIDPEVIAPLSKLQGMMGSQSVQVQGVIRGEDIWLINNKQVTRQARLG